MSEKLVFGEAAAAPPAIIGSTAKPGFSSAGAATEAVVVGAAGATGDFGIAAGAPANALPAGLGASGRGACGALEAAATAALAASPPCDLHCSSSFTSSCPDWKRSSGDFDSAFMMSALSAG